jgi:hypothetical protein
MGSDNLIQINEYTLDGYVYGYGQPDDIQISSNVVDPSANGVYSPLWIDTGGGGSTVQDQAQGPSVIVFYQTDVAYSGGGGNSGPVTIYSEANNQTIELLQPNMVTNAPTLQNFSGILTIDVAGSGTMVDVSNQGIDQASKLAHQFQLTLDNIGNQAGAHDYSINSEVIINLNPDIATTDLNGVTTYSSDDQVITSTNSTAPNQQWYDVTTQVPTSISVINGISYDVLFNNNALLLVQSSFPSSTPITPETPDVSGPTTGHLQMDNLHYDVFPSNGIVYGYVDQPDHIQIQGNMDIPTGQTLTIDGGGGGDQINTGPGREAVVYYADDVQYQGGGAHAYDIILVESPGTTAYLIGNDYPNFSNIQVPQIHNFSEVDLTGQNETLVVSQQGLDQAAVGGQNAMTGTDHTMIVDYNQGNGDAVSLYGSGWVESPTLTTLSNGIAYDVWTNQHDMIYLENQLTAKPLSASVTVDPTALATVALPAGDTPGTPGDTLSLTSLGTSTMFQAPDNVTYSIVNVSGMNEIQVNADQAQAGTYTDIVPYTVTESNGLTSSSTLTFTTDVINDFMLNGNTASMSLSSSAIPPVSGQDIGTLSLTNVNPNDSYTFTTGSSAYQVVGNELTLNANPGTLPAGPLSVAVTAQVVGGAQTFTETLPLTESIGLTPSEGTVTVYEGNVSNALSVLLTGEDQNGDTLSINGAAYTLGTSVTLPYGVTLSVTSPSSPLVPGTDLGAVIDASGLTGISGSFMDSFVIAATDSHGDSASQTISINILAAPPTIPSPLPSPLQGTTDADNTSPQTLGNLITNGNVIEADPNANLQITAASLTSITLPSEYAALGLASEYTATAITPVAGAVATYNLSFLSPADNPYAVQGPAQLSFMSDGAVDLTTNDAMEFLPSQEAISIAFAYTVAGLDGSVQGSTSFMVTGTANNDVLVATSNGQILTGGNGNDLFFDEAPSGSAVDMIAGSGNDTFIAAAGNHDTLDFSHLNNGITLDLTQTGTAQTIYGSTVDMLKGTFAKVIGTNYGDTFTVNAAVLGTTDVHDGTGANTLIWNDAVNSLNLDTYASQLQNFQIIDLLAQNAPQALTLSVADVAAVAGSGDTLTINGSTGDKVIFDPVTGSATNSGWFSASTPLVNGYYVYQDGAAKVDVQAGLGVNISDTVSNIDLNLDSVNQSSSISGETIDAADMAGSVSSIDLMATAQGGGAGTFIETVSTVPAFGIPAGLGTASIGGDTISLGDGADSISLSAAAQGGNAATYTEYVLSSNGEVVFTAAPAGSGTASIDGNTLSLGNGADSITLAASAQGGVGGVSETPAGTQVGSFSAGGMTSIDGNTINLGNGMDSVTLSSSAVGGNNPEIANETQWFAGPALLVSGEANILSNTLHAGSGTDSFSLTAIATGGSAPGGIANFTDDVTSISAEANVNSNTLTTAGNDGSLILSSTANGGSGANEADGGLAISAEANMSSNTLTVTGNSDFLSLSALAQGGEGQNIAVDNTIIGNNVGTAISSEVSVTNNLLDDSHGTSGILSLMVTATPGTGPDVNFGTLSGIYDDANVTVTGNSLLGGSGNDQFTFLVTAPNANGNDVFDISGNILNGSAGINDTFTVNSLAMGANTNGSFAPTQIDGGTGTQNTLIWDDTNTFNLDTYAPQLQNIQIIDLSQPSTALILSAADVTEIAGSGQTLTVNGTPGDMINFDAVTGTADNSGWYSAATPTELIGGVTYDVYQNGSDAVLVQEGLGVNISNTVSNIDLSSTDGLPQTSSISGETIDAADMAGSTSSIDLATAAQGGGSQSTAGAGFGEAYIETTTISLGNGNNDSITLSATATGGDASAVEYGLIAGGAVLFSGAAVIDSNTLSIGSGNGDTLTLNAMGIGGGVDSTSTPDANVSDESVLETAVSGLAEISTNTITMGSGNDIVNLLATAEGGSSLSSNGVANDSLEGIAISALTNVSDDMISMGAGNHMVNLTVMATGGDAPGSGGVANQSIVGGEVTVGSISAYSNVTDNTLTGDGGTNTFTLDVTSVGGSGGSDANLVANGGIAISAGVNVVTNQLNGSLDNGDTLSLVVTATPGSGSDINNGGTINDANVTVTGNSLLGGSGNDQFTFLVTAPNANGNDVFDISGNTLNGASGLYDTFTVNNLAMGVHTNSTFTPTQIDGGTGAINPSNGPIDTSLGHVNALLWDDNATLNLDALTGGSTDSASQLHNIQEVVVGSAAGQNSAVTVTLNEGDIQQMDGSGGSLFIKGDAADTVTFKDPANWTHSASLYTDSAGTAYDVYTSLLHETLYVQHALHHP